jgi:hypothetical protein
MNLFTAARKICESFTYDPGHSDLDNEQPIAIHCTLGDWRRLNSALMLAGQRADQPEDRLTTKAVLNAMQDHYWDSLEPNRDIVMKHVEGVLRLFEQSHMNSGEPKEGQ